MLAGLLCLCFTAPAWADLSIKQILIEKRSPNVNIRVIVDNPGTMNQPGPVLIKLYVRHDSSQSWDLIKTWNDISVVKPGNEIARDFFSQNNAELSKLAKGQSFEARAVVTAAGLRDVESTSIWGNT